MTIKHSTSAVPLQNRSFQCVNPTAGRVFASLLLAFLFAAAACGRGSSSASTTRLPPPNQGGGGGGTTPPPIDNPPRPLPTDGTDPGVRLGQPAAGGALA